MSIKIKSLHWFSSFLLFLLLAIGTFFLNALIVQANIETFESDDGLIYSRSLESLRDLDYETWQLVVYPSNEFAEGLVLRIVGYPGTLRFDHPKFLEVHAGRKDWYLKDITLSNVKLAQDSRAAAAEFDLTSLILDLNNNRPLRLILPGVLNELPVPPYLVAEWRSLLKEETLY